MGVSEFEGKAYLSAVTRWPSPTETILLFVVVTAALMTITVPTGGMMAIPDPSQLLLAVSAVAVVLRLLVFAPYEVWQQARHAARRRSADDNMKP